MVEVPIEDYPPTSSGETGVPVLQVGDVETLATSTLRGRHRLIRMGERGASGSPILRCPEIVTAGMANLGRPVLGVEAGRFHYSPCGGLRAARSGLRLAAKMSFVEQ